VHVEELTTEEARNNVNNTMRRWADNWEWGRSLLVQLNWSSGHHKYSSTHNHGMYRVPTDVKRRTSDSLLRQLTR